MHSSGCSTFRLQFGNGRNRPQILGSPLADLASAISPIAELGVIGYIAITSFVAWATYAAAVLPSIVTILRFISSLLPKIRTTNNLAPRAFSLQQAPKTLQGAHFAAYRKIEPPQNATTLLVQPRKSSYRPLRKIQHTREHLYTTFYHIRQCKISSESKLQLDKVCL